MTTKINSKFSDLFLEIFASILTSSVVLAHLRQSSVVFGNIEIIGNCWKMAKKYINLFGTLFIRLWKIIYCYSAKKFYRVTPIQALLLLAVFDDKIALKHCQSLWIHPRSERK